MECIECNKDILKKNKLVVESWRKERQNLFFWYWCGVTDHGKSELSPYDTELMTKFDKYCKLD